METPSDAGHLKLDLQRIKNFSTNWPAMPQHYRRWPCHTPPSPPHLDDPWPHSQATTEFIKKTQRSSKYGVADELEVTDLRLSDLQTDFLNRPQNRITGKYTTAIEEDEDEDEENGMLESKRKVELLPLDSPREGPLKRAEEIFYDPISFSSSNSRASLASLVSLASIPEEVEIRTVGTQTSREYGGIFVGLHDKQDDETDTKLVLRKDRFSECSASSSSPSSSEEPYLLKRRGTQTEFPITAGETCILRREGDVTQNGETVNILEAFGTAQRHKNVYEEKYKVVTEIKINGITKRYLIPRKYAAIGKWVFFGTRVYIFKGHSFVRYKAQPLILKLCCCLGKDFRYNYDHYCCRDCRLRCIKINSDQVQDYCTESSVDLQEMEFPYDSTHIRLI